MRDSMKTITMTDVAREAGVSQSTVSRVLNNVPSISDETCENVRKAVLKLRYCVRTGVNRTQIAFLMCPFSEQQNPFSFDFFSNMLRGAQEVAEQEKYELLIRTLPAECRKLPENLNLEQLAGVVLINSPTREIIALLNELKIPAVAAAADSFEEPSRIDVVINDNLFFGRSACRYMLERGIDNFGILLPRCYTTRLLGIALEMKRHGREIDLESLPLPENTEIAEIIRSFCRLWSTPPHPRGLIVPYYVAAQALEPILNGYGLQVPNDIEIFTLGFHEEQTHFPMVLQYPCEIGRKSIQALLWRIRNPESIPTTYMVGATLANIRTPVKS